MLEVCIQIVTVGWGHMGTCVIGASRAGFACFGLMQEIRSELAPAPGPHMCGAKRKEWTSLALLATLWNGGSPQSLFFCLL